MRASMRGAAPVGRIDDFAPMEAAAVLYSRLWHDIPDAQRRLRDFARLLGIAASDHAVQALADFGNLCARHGRRPFLQHHPACRHDGADEACLANLVPLSLEGEREDALLIATLLVRSDFSRNWLPQRKASDCLFDGWCCGPLRAWLRPVVPHSTDKDAYS